MKTGDSVSHYRILEPLGAGGMGVVYKAEDTRLKRLVALKFLPVALGQDPEAKNRLVQEAQAASALDHPNICTIYEINETEDGQLFLAMACYDGETLKSRLARGAMPVDAALSLFTSVVRGVAAAHDAGIIHRDIKPANIIVTSRGDVKLLDFGIAKLQGQTSMTRTGMTLGTVAYMSPEQVMGGPIDARSDVWSLGALLFEMLAGRPPFAGPGDAAVLHAIASTSPPVISDVRPDAPPAIGRIVARALEKEPAARFASAGEMLRELDALHAVHATTAAHAAPIAPAAAAGRGPWLAVAAVVLAVVAAGGWFAIRQSRVRRARTQDLPRLSELIRKEQPAQAYRLMRELEPLLADDPEFVTVRDGFLFPTAIRSTPPGADVSIKGYNEPALDWQHLGRTPIDVRLPRAYFRFQASKPGFATLEVARGAATDVSLTLSADGALPAGMVRVPGGTAKLPGDDVPFGEFFLDTFEVTNSAYKDSSTPAGIDRQTSGRRRSSTTGAR